MGNPPYDDYDTDLGALDPPRPGDDAHDHGLSAFDDYLPSLPEEDTAAGSDAETGESLFSVTNPPGTVTVSAHFDGRVHRIELSPEAAASPEADLAAEIVVIAGLATQRAKAAQFSYMLEGMQGHGYDTLDTRDFLHRNVGLPSPEETDAAQAAIFATRYAGDHD